MEAVAQILAQRTRQHASERGLWSLGAAALLHVLVLVAALVLPRLKPPPEPLEFVAVQIVPLQALGVERPRARSRPKVEAPEPEPAPPQASEPVPPEPEPALEPEDDRPALPKEEPEKEKPRPAAPEPKEPPRPDAGRREEKTPPRPAGGDRGGPGGGVAEIGKGDEQGRRGSPAGNPLGTSAFGSSIAGLEDPNFGYGYYIDRLLQLIDANWERPSLGGQVRAVLYFRIRRDGAIEDLRVAESSGYNSFDLAALRAVQNAAPFPALPASYRPGSLGVNLIVH